MAAHEVNMGKELGGLELLEKKMVQGSGSAREIYLQVRAVKRAIMLKNPVLDFTRDFAGGHALPARFGVASRDAAPAGVHGRSRRAAAGVGRLATGWRGKAIHAASTPAWVILAAGCELDGERVVFCFKPHNEKSFHLYEIHADGGGLRQITDGPYDDLDPIYPPDDRNVILFDDTRHTYVRCMPPTSAFVLARCELTGRTCF